MPGSTAKADRRTGSGGGDVNSVTLFLLFLKGSSFSTGGFGNVPILHPDLVGRHWATDRQFAEALAVGQVSPGPNGLWVVSLGYLIDGLQGSLLAVAALLIPPFVVLLWERVYQKIKHHPVVEGVMRGLGLAVVGVFVIVLARILQAGGLDWKAGLLLVGSAFLGFSKRIPVVAVLAVGGVAGLWLYR